MFALSHRVSAHCLFAASALLLVGAASAASLDDDKLRLLSCDVEKVSGAGQDQAIAWLNSYPAKTAGEGNHIPGPIMLGKACLKDVRFIGSFGVAIIQGEICNATLEEFTGALAAVGTTVTPDFSGKPPAAVLGMKQDKRQYIITTGLVDMRSGKAAPTSRQYGFTCSATSGGPQ